MLGILYTPYIEADLDWWVVDGRKVSLLGGEQLDCGRRTNAMVGLNLLWIILARSHGAAAASSQGHTFTNNLQTLHSTERKGRARNVKQAGR